MANITGSWEFHRACPPEVLVIGAVDDAGGLVDAYITDAADNMVTLNGHYDAATNQISFNDARLPGETLFVSFYTGYVMPTGAAKLDDAGNPIPGDEGVCAMAGTYTEQEIIFEQYLAERHVEERRVAGLGGILATPTLHAAWYAIWQNDIEIIE